MKKRKAVVYTITVLVLGFILNFLFGIMPDDFKNSVNHFSGSIGLSYTLFWIICTLVIIVVMLFFVWKKVRHTETEKTQISNKTNTRNIKQGKKSVYVEKHEGPINMNN